MAPSAPTAKNPGNGWLAGRDWNPGALRRKNNIQRLTQKRNRFLFCLAVYIYNHVYIYIYTYTIVYVQCVYIINKRNTSKYFYSNILEWGRGKRQKQKNRICFPKIFPNIVPLFIHYSIPIGSMYAIYGNIYIHLPSIYPLYVSIHIPAPWIRHGILGTKKSSSYHPVLTSAWPNISGAGWGPGKTSRRGGLGNWCSVDGMRCVRKCWKKTLNPMVYQCLSSCSDKFKLLFGSYIMLYPIFRQTQWQKGFLAKHPLSRAGAGQSKHGTVSLLQLVWQWIVLPSVPA